MQSEDPWVPPRGAEIMARLFSASPRGIWNFIINNLNGCRIATGQYTGDSTVAQAITGIGFRPKVVDVCQLQAAELANTSQIFRKTDQDPTDISVFISGADALDNRLISLDADGFTVDDDGTGQHPNKLNQVYHYIAWG